MNQRFPNHNVVSKQHLDLPQEELRYMKIDMMVLVAVKLVLCHTFLYIYWRRTGGNLDVYYSHTG